MSKLSRRTFIQRAALGTAAFYISRNGFAASPNDKLNIGFVGTANQARFSINNLNHQNIVALCDIDDNLLAKASHDLPGAKTYNDFRQTKGR